MRILTVLSVVAGLLLATTACDKSKETTSYPSNTASIDALNSLRRGELSAVESYRQAIDKEGSQAGQLSAIRADHEDAAERLRQRIVALGGVPAATSGAWGDFVKAIEGTAKIFGNEAAMAALKAGEKKGINDYEEALNNDKLDVESKDLIRVTLLPRQRMHVDQLADMIKVQ